MKPHKACDAQLDKIKLPAIIMPKLDGVRACNFGSGITTRTLKQFRNKRMDCFSSDEYLWMDGEIVLGGVFGEGLCRKTTSFCNSYRGNTLEIDIPTWHIFDYLLPSLARIGYIDRYHSLVEHVRCLKRKDAELYSNIEVVPGYEVNHIDDVLEFHSEHMSKGYEGTIIRHSAGKHKNGRCTVNEGAFLRIKDIVDEEAVILALVEAEENNNKETTNELGYTTRSSHKENKVPKGMIGSLIARIPDGREIKIGAGEMTHDMRRFYFQNPHEIIGRVCTYKFMPYGEKDMRRHPRFKCFREGDI